MTVLQNAETGYAAAAPIRTPQSAEYETFARVTRQIRAASEDPAGFAKLASALHDNRRFWILLATDVADDGNALPDALRAQIFYLAEFTLGHSDKVLAGEATTDVLVEINTAVMKGLRGQEMAA